MRKIGIIGGGNLGGALYKALAVKFGADNVLLCDRHEEKLRAAGAVKTYTDPRELLNEVEVIILAVKPQAFEALMSQVGILAKDRLIISVMAGTSLARIGMLTGARRIVRAMPNFAVKVGKAVVGWIASTEVSNEEKELIRTIWEDLGFQIEVKDEGLIDCVTALSGSGLAYFFYLCELLEEQARDYGFSKDEARTIAETTFIGAAHTLQGAGRSAQKWREAVTSRGGTTAAALGYLQEHGFSAVFKQAIEKARQRAKELGGQNQAAANGSVMNAEQITAEAVRQAQEAFKVMGEIADQKITSFFEGAAKYLTDDDAWHRILKINQQDVEQAKARGRSTTRLIATEQLRKEMIDGLKQWVALPSRRGEVVEQVKHHGWKVELKRAELGVVGFVFEGRPDVVVDATGVLRGGNTVVFRIGSDALGTAKVIMEEVIRPALKQAGLPEGAVVLIESPTHEAAQALVSDKRLALAVVRGSGAAVQALEVLARQAGVPVSLHGTGGAWMIASEYADVKKLEAFVINSLDRKVCNTLNTFCVVRSRAAELVPVFLSALQKAGERRGQNFKLHIVEGSEKNVPPELFRSQAELLKKEDLGKEWEWEETPEVTLVAVENVEEAVNLFNQYSPQFVASLISEDKKEQEMFYRKINAPFVSNGFTRWVDGLYTFNRPELGLSNWQHGRLLGRGGILSGDSVFTVRTVMSQDDPEVRR